MQYFIHVVNKSHGFLLHHFERTYLILSYKIGVGEGTFAIHLLVSEIISTKQ
jgi:hypothetical protein